MPRFAANLSMMFTELPFAARFAAAARAGFKGVEIHFPYTEGAPEAVAGWARAAGVEIIGDVELFVRERRAHAPACPFIAIE